MNDEGTPVCLEMSVAEALKHLRDSPQAALPIIEPATGELLGYVTRHIDHSRLESPPQPPRLGGMATPLGVYLTDGVTCGGAGFWGLFLTGLTLGLLALTAQGITHGFLTILARAWHPHFGSSAPMAALHEWVDEMTALLPLPLVFVLLRLVPLSGTHAAEHQVVHCIERGTPLAPSCARMMPRVHPRCGTNLFAGLFLFLLTFLSAFWAAQAAAVPVPDGVMLGAALAAMPALLLWRRVGGWVQQWFATRPATEPQMAGAIRAAEQVLARRAALPYGIPIRFHGPRRLWRMGLVQVLLGYLALLGPLSLLAPHWPWLERLLGA